MSSELLLDAAGRRRSPSAMPGHHAGHAPKNKGQVYPADPPTVEEIVAVMRQTRLTGTTSGSGRWSSCSGATGSGFQKRCR